MTDLRAEAYKLVNDIRQQSRVVSSESHLEVKRVALQKSEKDFKVKPNSAAYTKASSPLLLTHLSYIGTIKVSQSH